MWRFLGQGGEDGSSSSSGDGSGTTSGGTRRSPDVFAEGYVYIDDSDDEDEDEDDDEDEDGGGREGKGGQLENLLWGHEGWAGDGFDVSLEDQVEEM